MNEANRNAALGEHALVDAPPELALKRLSQLATELFGVPIALITVLDLEERPRTLASHGLPSATEPEPARVFAMRAAASDQVTVIDDAAADPGFADQPWVVDAPGIRFYAGAPLIDAGGRRRGAFAIADSRPRRLDEEQRRTLAALAGVAMDEIRLAAPSATGAAPQAAVIDQEAVDAEVRLGFVTGQLPAILWTTDRELRFSSAIGAGLGAIGLRPDQVVGVSLDVFFAGDPLAPRNIEAHQAALEGRSTSTDARFGSRIYQCRIDPLRDPDGRITGTIGVALDITDRKRMEAKLIQAERLASMGTLAAGVAHEINNPLTYVMANIGYVSERLGKLAVELAVARSADHSAGSVVPKAFDVTELTAALAEAQEGTVRVRQIIRDLRILARGDEERFAPIDVRQVIESSLTMVWNQIRHRAELIKDLGDVPLVEASESRLGQVVLNLLINAVQAIPADARSNQQIRISTRTDTVGRAVITVSDTGTGIPPEVLGRIFDPFFTTKPVGTGTGLGLFICHGIVKALGGEISVESKAGQGATFRVALLPARTRVPTIPIVREARAGVNPARPRLLLVDDEVNVGRGLERSLAPDYDLVVVQSGREAFATLAVDDRFDAILCDLIMPTINGMDLFTQLERDRPDLAKKVVFITGGAFTPGAQAFLDRVPNHRLEKPFDVALLGGILRSLADG